MLYLLAKGFLILLIGRAEGGEGTIKGLIGSWLVYFVMIAIVGISLAVGQRLPEELWKRADEE